MPEKHLIVGAGPVGRHVAELLVAEGSHVEIATRSGTDTGIHGANHIAVDAANGGALSAAASGASVLYNCANPGNYTQWDRAWPPLAAAFLEATERTGAVYAITGNLYPYGPVNGPMHEGLPDAATDHKGRLRAEMWADAKALHEAGRIRAVEVRGSDYMGRGVGQNGHISRVVPAAFEGKRAWFFDRDDQPHTFTDVLDVARLLIAAARDESAHGRTWHVPSNEPRTPAQAINDVMDAAGRPHVKTAAVPGWTVTALAAVSPLVRELRELAYQRNRPYVLDDSAAREHFGMQPTLWAEVCRRTAVL